VPSFFENLQAVQELKSGHEIVNRRTNTGYNVLCSLREYTNRSIFLKFGSYLQYHRNRLKDVAAVSILKLKVLIKRAPVKECSSFSDKTVHNNVTATKCIKDSVYQYLC